MKFQVFVVLPHTCVMGVWVDLYTWCVTDWGVSVITTLMKHKESYSNVSVIRINWYLRCGYSDCVSLYVSDFGWVRYK